MDRDSLAAGDLVFLRTKGPGPFFKKRHVGIYVGDGEFIHASSSRGVTTTRLDDDDWTRKYRTARRVVEQGGALTAAR